MNRACEEMVPSAVRAQVAHRTGEEQEASRRFAIFHIKEHGEEYRFLTNHDIEFLDAGRLLAAMSGPCRTGPVRQKALRIASGSVRT